MKLRSVAVKLLSLLVGSSGCAGDRPEVIRLWPEGAPGSEQRRHEAEIVKDWWVANVHDPSLTVVRPKLGTGTGAAVIVIPGGGHSQLVFEPEGMAPAHYLARHGVTAFALKYRLANEEGSSYSVEEHALADVRRAVRWVRGAADLPPSLPASAPPAFFLAASDDVPAARTIERLLSLYQNAGIPVEVHLYQTGGHAFNMGSRSESQAIRRWPERLTEWLEVRGLGHARD